MDRKAKAGLVTFHAALNFGSALQAYATQRLVENEGVTCEIIDYRTRSQTAFYSGYSLRFGLKKAVLSALRIPEFRAMRQRKRRFESFWADRFSMTPATYTSYRALQGAGLHYPLMITGSDQVWNRHCLEFQLEPEESILPYYLAFGAPEKRIAYASSIGNMTRAELGAYQEHLERYDHIAVRETSAQDTLRSIVKAEVECVLDPTLALDPGEWEALLRDAPRAPRDYVFLYTLDPNPIRLKARLRALASLAEARGLGVVCCAPLAPASWIRLNRVLIDPAAGPLEFLSYVRDAGAVVTDSFHGTAFAVNFGVPFVAVQYAGDDRARDLLERLCLSDRAVAGWTWEEIAVILQRKPADYRQRLESCRRTARDCLKESLA